MFTFNGIESLYKIIKDNDINALHSIPANIIQRYADHMIRYIRINEINNITRIMAYLRTFSNTIYVTHDPDYVKYMILTSIHFNHYKALSDSIDDHHDETVKFIMSYNTDIYGTYIHDHLEAIKSYTLSMENEIRRRTRKHDRYNSRKYEKKQKKIIKEHLQRLNEICKSYGYTSEAIKYLVNMPYGYDINVEIQSAQIITDALKESDGMTYHNLVHYVVYYHGNGQMIRHILLENYDAIIIKCDLHVNRAMARRTKKVSDDMITNHPGIIYDVTKYMSRRQVRFHRSVDPVYAIFIANSYPYWIKQRLIDIQTI